MAAVPYSHRFMIATGAGVFTSWTVPVGKRAVVRQLAGSNQDAVAGAVWVYVGALPVAVFIFPATTTSLNAETRIVYYGGEQMRCFTSTVKHAVALSGYLFDDPAHEAGPPGALIRKHVDLVEPLPVDAAPAWAPE